MDTNVDSKSTARSKIWGTVVKAGNRFRAKLRGGTHLDYFDTEAEAWEGLEAARRQLAGHGGATLCSFGNPWIEGRKASGLIRSWRNERSIWDHYIAQAPFYNRELKRVTPDDAERWLLSLTKAPAHRVITRGPRGARVTERIPTDKYLSAKSISHIRGLAYRAFETARLKGLIKVNPFFGVRSPCIARVIENDRKWSFLTPTEIESLFAALSGDERMTAFYAIAIFGGLRLGEILGLRWEDIHLSDPLMGRMEVRRQYGDKPLKTPRANRDVPVLPALRAALLAYQRQGGVLRVTGLLFANDKGGPLHKGYRGNWNNHPRGRGASRTVEKGWKSRAGIRSHVRFHDLRHTCAAHLRQGTWGVCLAIADLMDWLGHSDQKTTLRYAKLGPQSLLNLVAKALR